MTRQFLFSGFGGQGILFAGKFVAYKSGDTTEIHEADNAYKTLGGKLVQVIEYALPEGYGDRVLAVVEKVKPTPPRYPRGQGKERKNPL